jgi:PAS domain S-box-containing protein
MRFYKTVSFKIWASFTLVMGMLMIVLAYYYPKRQRESIMEFKKNELHELANSLAQSIENSLRNDDFFGLQESIKHASENKDFAFVAAIIDEGGKKRVLAVSPQLDHSNVLKRDNDVNLYETHEFITPSIKGEVLIAFSKTRVEQAVNALNKPIYYIILGLFLLSIVLFYFIANIISRPIRALTRITSLLHKEDYQSPLVEIKYPDEIGELNNSVILLQSNLNESREKNKRLTSGLEEEIMRRTSQLESAHKKLMEAQIHAKIVNFDYNFSTKSVYISDNFKALVGVETHSSLSFDEIIELIHEEDREEVYLALSGNELNKDIIKDIRFVQPKTQAVVTLNCAAKINHDSQNNSKVLYGTLQDITYRKRMEDELRELSLVARNTSNCVIITDKNKRITWVNASVIKLTGYSYEEIIGNSPKMFQFEKTNIETVNSIRHHLEKEEEVSTEILNRGKNGNEYWLELNIVPLKKMSGEVYGYMAVETDITKLKKSEEEIRKMNESLEQRVLENTRKNLDLSRSLVEQEKLATIGEISAGIAHDLNTPLGASKVGAENLREVIRDLKKHLPSLSPSEQQMAIEFSEKFKAQMGASGLQKMKDRSIVEAYLKQNLQRELHDLTLFALQLVDCGVGIPNESELNRILQTKDPETFVKVLYGLQLTENIVDGIVLSTEKASNVVKDVRAFINKGVTPERQWLDVQANIQVVLNVFSHELRKNVQLNTQFKEGLKIHGFDVKLFQLWSNIIKNALDAMDGQVEKKIIIDTKSNNGDVIVEISNNGPKIPTEIVHNIFKKFFSTKREKSGSGLGLSIVKNVLDEHGANISVTSDEDLTTFKIVFPKI